MYKERLKFKRSCSPQPSSFFFSLLLLFYKESFPLPYHTDSCEWISLGAQEILGRRKESNTHSFFFFFLNSVKVFIVLATFGGDLDHYSPSINELGCEQDWELELRTIYLFILLFSWGKIMISPKNFLEWLSKSNLKSHSKSCDAPLSSSPPVIVLTLPWQWHPIWTQL